MSGLPVFEEEREVFGYEIQSPLRGHSLQSFREAVYLRLQGGEDLVKERPEGGSLDFLRCVCLFLCHICLWIIYLNKDTISYRILQVITGYYTTPQISSWISLERCRVSWIEIYSRGRSGAVFGTAQNTGYPGVCPGLLGPDLPGLRILLSTTLVNRSGPGAGREIAPDLYSPRESPQGGESLLCYPPGSEGRCTRYTTPGGGQNKNSVEGFSTEFPGAVSACVVGRGIVFAGEGYNLQHKDTDYSPHSHSKYLLFPEPVERSQEAVSKERESSL